jgi:hypothetical protein
MLQFVNQPIHKYSREFRQAKAGRKHFECFSLVEPLDGLNMFKSIMWLQLGLSTAWNSTSQHQQNLLKRMQVGRDEKEVGHLPQSRFQDHLRIILDSPMVKCFIPAWNQFRVLTSRNREIKRIRQKMRSDRILNPEATKEPSTFGSWGSWRIRKDTLNSWK